MKVFCTLAFLVLLSCFCRAPVAHAFKCDVTATGLNFGNYNIFDSAPVDSSANISVSCNIPSKNPNAPLMVTLTVSPGNSGTFSQRQMLSGTPTPLNYNLYTNAAASSVWGDGSGSSTTLSNTVTKQTPWSTNIFGRIPAQQNVQPGAYTDVVTVTVLF